MKIILAIPVSVITHGNYRYSLSILLCHEFIINHKFVRSDAIHPVTVLSGQVDSQIVEGHTGRTSSVISAADAMLFMTVLSNHVDSQIDEDAIRLVTVLSNKVDSVIDEENACSVNFIRNFHQLFLATESHNF
ncbi:hypothetical protein DAPPUDRAFT_118328 [Daphnia pulex]|uniref:Uncharacterized protein n=1 Tax=Daphnia pulex TaxID=6669 RepID=E9HVF4_DAPPU|nr:hypothetical protein DAPPUDRAFT_120730 [Daphnia pulex]EFX64276.1 hypothetical protein DAPPUDRAFT_118328 [Daphnia pulex]|eukprot:EFX61945.1 hypothetical protein DAPPUDRAFT_120730 [Daphnia pulex]